MCKSRLRAPALAAAVMLVLTLAGRSASSWTAPRIVDSASMAESIRATIEQLAAGATSTERQEAVVHRLEALGLASRLEPFSRKGQTGTNVVAAPVGAGKQLLLGAHYDRSKVGQGAVDNASGVAVALELLAAFKRQPLKKHAVAAVLFDLHEVGLFGSEEYVARHAADLPALYVNVETFGYGDTLFAMAEESDSPSARAVRDAAGAAKLAVEIGPFYPATDHLSFLQLKVPALSFSLASAEDVRLLKALLDPTAGRRNQVIPRLMKLIHSAEDLPDKTDSVAIARGAAVVEAALRKIDALE